MEAEEPRRRRRGGVYRFTLQDGESLHIIGLSLTDPASAADQSVVRVWAETGDVAHTTRRLWLAEPIGLLPSPVEFFDAGELVIRHDSAWSSVRLYGLQCRLHPDGGEHCTVSRFLTDIHAEELPVEEVEEEAAMVGLEYEPLNEEAMAERYDSDNDEDGDEEEEEEDPPRKPSDGEPAAGESTSKRESSLLVAAPAGSGVVPPDEEFLGPPRFAAVENTAAFMRIAAKEAAGDQQGKEILVLYRYTRFSRTWSGRRGVEACRRTKLHWLRFAVPPAGDMARSLAWAGSSLGPLIYPGLFRRELQDLWSSLAPPEIAATIPPQASRLQVIVDAGILRRGDHTSERMEHMRGALETEMEEAWPEYYHVVKELHLPETVPAPPEEEGEGEDTRPAKRRRLAAGEDEDELENECSVCFFPLESSLAAWPGCRHVFHAECVEKTLAINEMCPLCRQKLSDDPRAHKNSKIEKASTVCRVV